MRQFYRIYRSPSAGFFSNFFSVLLHTEIAETSSLTPFVDFSGVEMSYRQTSGDLSNIEPWEYFFSQPLRFNPKLIDEEADEVIDCGGGHPNPAEPIDPEALKSVWKRYYEFNEPTALHLAQQMTATGVGPRTLGILFRGLDMKTSPLHSLPPTIRQIRRAASIALATGRFDSILMVTESRAYSLMIGEVGGVKALRSDSRKIWMTWQRKRSRRLEHGYRSGLEVLTDAYLLSKCGGLVYSNSNIASASFLFREEPLSARIRIFNGVNVSSWPLARVYWYLKAMLPERFGGFGEKSIREEPSMN